MFSSLTILAVLCVGQQSFHFGSRGFDQWSMSNRLGNNTTPVIPPATISDFWKKNSWAFVHFCLQNKKCQSQFGQGGPPPATHYLGNFFTFNPTCPMGCPPPPCRVFAYICANTCTSVLKKLDFLSIVSLERGSTLFTPMKLSRFSKKIFS